MDKSVYHPQFSVATTFTCKPNLSFAQIFKESEIKSYAAKLAKKNVEKRINTVK